MLDSKLVQEIINSSYPDIDLDSVLNFDHNSFLNNLMKYKNVLDMMEIAEYAFDCYLINRFIPMETETELEKESFKLAQNGSFFAGNSIYYFDYFSCLDSSTSQSSQKKL